MEEIINQRVGVKFSLHKHLLFPSKGLEELCVGCCEVRVEPDGGYACDDPDDHCDCEGFFVHKNCFELINPSHPTHTLSLIRSVSFDECSVCDVVLRDGYGYSYPFGEEASICGGCASKELYIDPKKSHEHRLFVLLKPFFSFPCDACGLANGESYLCVCIPCRFTIHRYCVDLPRVICINRHDDRISYVPRLVPGEWENCGVCRQKIDGRYGAYSCSNCSFFSHSRCATRRDVWDGIDLEGVPEDDPKDIIPFIVVREGVIKHFTHQHDLNFITEDDVGYDKNKQCHACVLPIFSGPCYVSTEGDFILHERCANLPKKKRHISHQRQFTLQYEIPPFFCFVCQQFCNGFAYRLGAYRVDGSLCIDVRCVLIFDGYVHKSQPDSMLLARPRNSDIQTCSCCGMRGHDKLLKLSGHDNLFMCYKCATMPLHVIYKHDAHPLSLRFIENSTGDYWCEICEKIVDPQKWFYTCDECCTTLHIDCLLGIHPYLRVGSAFRNRRMNQLEGEVLRNNFATRPSCVYCSKTQSTSRIVDALVLMINRRGFFCATHFIS